MAEQLEIIFLIASQTCAIASHVHPEVLPAPLVLGTISLSMGENGRSGLYLLLLCGSMSPPPTKAQKTPGVQLMTLALRMPHGRR